MKLTPSASIRSTPHKLSPVSVLSRISQDVLFNPDISDLTSLFVERDGSGGSPNPNELAGVVLNKAGFSGREAEAYIAGLPELSVDTFQDASTAPSTATLINGVFTANADGQTSRPRFEYTTSANDWVLIEYTRLTGTETISVNVGSSSGADNLGVATFGESGTLLVQATSSSTWVNFIRGGTTVVTGTVRVTVIPNEHLTAPTDGERPTVRKWPITPLRRNIHPYSGVPTLSSTGMLTPSNTNGVSSSLVGSGVENGLPYIDVRFQGTTTGVFHVAYFEIFFGDSVSGRTMTQSVYTKLVGGTTDNITNIVHRCEPSSTTVIEDTPISLTNELVRTSETGTSIADNTNNSYGIAFTFSSGVAIDITIRIAAPQIEIGTTATEFQPTFNNEFSGRRNLFSNSVDLTVTSDWNRFGVLAGIPTADEPFVGAGGVIFTEDSTPAGEHNVQYVYTVTSGLQYTFSIYIKAGTRRYIHVRNGANGGGGNLRIDTTDFSVAAETGTDSYSITDVGNGWHKVSITDTAVGTGVTGYRFAFYDDSQNVSYDGDGTSTVLVSAPQLELGYVATTYQAVTNENHIEEEGVRSEYSLVYDNTGLAGNFASGAGPSDCSVFFAIKTDDIAFVPFSRSGGQYIAFSADATVAKAGMGTNCRVIIDGKDYGTNPTRTEIRQPIVDKGGFALVEYRNAELNTWPDFDVGLFPTSPSFNLNGQLIGPIIVETSKLTPALRNAIERYLKRLAGIT